MNLASFFGVVSRNKHRIQNTFADRAFVVVCLIAVSLVMVSSTGFSEEQNTVRWSQFTPDSKLRINHESWDKILKKYVVVDGQSTQVDYAAITEDSKKSLQDYLGELERIDISLYSKNEQSAFWLNLYNAATLYLVLEHYPVDSIRDISFGWFSMGPWKEPLVNFNSKKLSLDEIEKVIMPAVWQSPLTHYGFNCASIGCPNLMRDAFTGTNLVRQLEENARLFVNSSKGVVVISNSNKIRLSKIYKWYLKDFGGSKKALLEHIKKYADEGLLTKLESAPQSFRFQYDWSLNKLSK